MQFKKILVFLVFCFVIIYSSEAQLVQNSVKKVHVLTIGDSNGTFDFSWPQQLKKLLPQSTIVNKSISGNTIGFDNNDRVELNTIKNINRYLEEAFNEIGNQNNFDFILINLGTNDTKVVFNERQQEVHQNFTTLIQLIKEYLNDHQKLNTKICFITPAPMDELKVKVEKYGGGDLRVQENNEIFKNLVSKLNIGFINTYTPLKNDFSEKTTDGVHFNEKAQIQMAKEIVNYLKD